MFGQRTHQSLWNPLWKLRTQLREAIAKKKEASTARPAPSNPVPPPHPSRPRFPLCPRLRPPVPLRRLASALVRLPPLRPCPGPRVRPSALVYHRRLLRLRHANGLVRAHPCHRLLAVILPREYLRSTLSSKPPRQFCCSLTVIPF